MKESFPVATYVKPLEGEVISNIDFGDALMGVTEISQGKFKIHDYTEVHVPEFVSDTVPELIPRSDEAEIAYNDFFDETDSSIPRMRWQDVLIDLNEGMCYAPTLEKLRESANHIGIVYADFGDS